MVVLPLVPVTATKRFGSSRQASSSSPRTGMPRSPRRADRRRLPGTPGLLTTQRALRAARFHPYPGELRRPPRSALPLRRASRHRSRHLVARGGQQARRGLARAGQPDDQVRPAGKRRSRFRHPIEFW